MVQLRVVVAVVEPRRRTADIAADPVIVVHAADGEHADVVVDEAADRRGGADRGTIRLDVRPDLGMRVSGDAEDTDAGGTGAFERFQVGSGEPQRRMRALDRPRHHLARRQVEMFALVAGEMLLLEHLHHRLERLATDLAAVLGIGVEAETFHHIGRRAAAGAEFAAAVGQHVQVATRSAIMNGLWHGIRMTAKPSLIVRVRCDSAARNISGQGEWPISAKKCCSVSQKWLNPACSAATTWSRFCQ